MGMLMEERKQISTTMIMKLLLLLGITVVAQCKDWEYPVDYISNVTDDYFGTVVADPFRHLESVYSPITEHFIEKENEITQKFLHSDDYSDVHRKLHSRYDELLHVEDRSLPRKIGSKYYVLKRSAQKDKQYLIRSDAPFADENVEVIIDPNLWENDADTLASYSFSRDNSILLYSIQLNGSDFREIRFIDMSTNEELPDVIEGMSPSFYGTEGIYYRTLNGTGLLDYVTTPTIWYHKFGTNVEDDIQIYSIPEQPLLWIGFSLITDRGTNITYMRVTRGNMNPLLIRIPQHTIWKELEMNFSNKSLVRTTGEETDPSQPVTYWFRTYLFHNNFELVKYVNPLQHETIIPGKLKEALMSVYFFENQWICTYTWDSFNYIHIHDVDGQYLGDIEPPLGRGTIFSLSASPEPNVLYIGYTNHLQPHIYYSYNVKTKVWKVEFEVKYPEFESKDYHLVWHSYTSKDGQRVPMWLSGQNSVVENPRGDTPVYLYSYGGFSVNHLPTFDPKWILWLEMGGILAFANIRGGTEYGEDWHQEGMRFKKKTCFDDFIAAAEYLISRGITNNEKIAIGGRSNGGLLAATVVLQRPDLFGASIPEVGVNDMLRYQKLTRGYNWINEYLSSEIDEEQFSYLYSYSPLHIVNRSTVYPPVLIMVAQNDDRVHPAHSYKLAAEMQSGIMRYHETPILLRSQEASGHGTKRRNILVDEGADRWTFLQIALKIPIPSSSSDDGESSEDDATRYLLIAIGAGFIGLAVAAIAFILLRGRRRYETLS